MPTWTILLYNPDEDKSMEFQMDSDTEPTNSEILDQLDIFVSIENLD